MNKITMNVTDLVKTVAENAGTTQKSVREIIDVIQAVTIEQLKQADAENSVEVKIVPGISLVSTYAEAHEAKNPATGETITVEAKKYVKAKVGGAFKNAVNEE